MRTMILSLAAVVAALAPASAALAADPVYVMRHLQKGEGADPPLSAQGAANAKLLAATLGDKHIKAVFATPYLRTQQTALAVADAAGVKVTSYDPRDPQALLTAVKAIAGAVLIVGHSNTVPDIIARLGGRPVPVIGEEDFGIVYVVDANSGTVGEIKVGR